jgi:hypothetical protein
MAAWNRADPPWKAVARNAVAMAIAAFSAWNLTEGSAGGQMAVDWFGHRASFEQAPFRFSVMAVLYVLAVLLFGGGVIVALAKALRRR